jgi:LysM repeat protein
MKYTVLAGDTLAKLAVKFLGDKNKYKEIMAINPQIKDPNKIYPGQIINIPDSPKTPTTLPIQKSSVQPSEISQESGMINKLKMILSDKRVIFGLLALGATILYLKNKKR